MTISLPACRSKRMICQFGLSRAGLYAVADWFLHGMGTDRAVYEQIRAGCIGDIATPPHEKPNRFLTLESLRSEVLRDGLARASEHEATTWIQLRDPYNWLSSLYQGVKTGVVMWRNPVNLDKWKDYARLCLRTGDWLSYNHWFADPDYRRALASNWEFTRNRDGGPWQRVPTEFAGSSFDDRRYRDRAQDMDVLRRYTQFVDQQWWREHFDDEAVELAAELFGMSRPW